MTIGAIARVFLTEKVEFSGAQDLTIDGRGATLDGSKAGGDPAFVVSGGGSLAVSSLTVRKKGSISKKTMILGKTAIPTVAAATWLSR